ncbi:hypothetical protein NDU88_004088 [Pleurodeles waltl]|uniref:Uncharacterized protein n=1 Tax=Pleurodeles waltl TaxID=8319 RepID=A0AAV7SHS1_PLEWA|nr:hypothetical protein NDU88_004088 [Pleurodeles waltl]
MVGRREAVRVKLAIVVSAKPLRLWFRGLHPLGRVSVSEACCGSSRTPASLFSGRRSSGALRGSPGPSASVFFVVDELAGRGLEQRDSAPQVGLHHRGTPWVFRLTMVDPFSADQELNGGRRGRCQVKCLFWWPLGTHRLPGIAAAQSSQFRRPSSFVARPRPQKT